jgi:hypothetical protein
MTISLNIDGRLYCLAGRLRAQFSMRFKVAVASNCIEDEGVGVLRC